MSYEEVMSRLADLGNTQLKNTYIKHGALEPLFGVKVGDLKKHLVKQIKQDQKLVHELFQSKNGDAMYLAGLCVDPKQMSMKLLNQWVKLANQTGWYLLSEYSVAQAAAESHHALEAAREWMGAKEEHIAAAGWSTYANYLSITPDDQIDLQEIKTLLNLAVENIHEERNRVRYVMNGFVIAVGTWVLPLHEEAKLAAETIGKVHVNMGETACKVPLASDYIKKVMKRNVVGKKRKTCIC